MREKKSRLLDAREQKLKQKLSPVHVSQKCRKISLYEDQTVHYMCKTVKKESDRNSKDQVSTRKRGNNNVLSLKYELSVHTLF
uniref:Uncharacterized protein n=1 Tax=Trichogramma kaykai TaxID=54128 RepID=A0ABD2XD60_9HYME